ncbi:MAG: 5-formyltetrahydrofolate cyclo-ligase [Gallionella sp.]
MTLITEKQQIRLSLLAAREQLTRNERAEFNARIIERLLQRPEYQQAHTVLAYMNFGSEFACDLWLEQVLADGKRLILPRVNRQTKRLNLSIVSDLTRQLAAGIWGIREPIIERCERLNDINEVEFALLPGIAFSRNGSRLGYGGGFYDKLLAQVSPCPTLVSAAFGLQIAAIIPQEPTDIKVDLIVTEAETINCKKQESSNNCSFRP